MKTFSLLCLLACTAACFNIKTEDLALGEAKAITAITAINWPFTICGTGDWTI